MRYEADPTLRKKTMSAEEVFKGGILKERTDTGRIYLVFIDNVINQGPFDPKFHTIYQSNLCQEIALPTKPLKHLYDEEGEISLCTLGAVNWGKIKQPKDFEKLCTLLVRGLDELLDYQGYPVLAAKISTMNRRPLGIGIINFAYWLANEY